MKIRFRCLTDSDVPEFPFRAGQTIEVGEMTPRIKNWLRADSSGVVHADLVREDEQSELAVVGTGERAVVKAKRRKG